ncbi:MAG: hypothetical protein RDU20_14045 [Desulfomonilaceae bacterium]|nr:hypothetical protein [Desulfomonilaceae bacterium]
MSRRDKWKSARDAMMAPLGKTKGVKTRESVPEVCCGKCEMWFENAYSSEGRGTCRVLKMGSEIHSDKPTYVLEGDAGLISYFNMDASHCSYFSKMELIDTDGTECSDPLFRRALRQMKKFNE